MTWGSLLAGIRNGTGCPASSYTLGLALVVLYAQFWTGDCRAEGTLRVRLPSTVMGVDWNKTSKDWFLMTNIMEGLVELGPQGDVQPALAKRWSVSPDYKLYAFDLRDEAVWSDGRPVLAQHFIDAWVRVLSPLTASPYAGLLRHVEGVDAWLKSGANLNNLEGIGLLASGAHRLEIRLSKSDPDFLHKLTYRALFPTRKDQVGLFGGPDTALVQLAVTGPFRIVDYKPATKVIVARNPLYYGESPSLDRIEFIVETDDEKAIERFKKGEFDFVPRLGFKTLNGKNLGQELHEILGFTLSYLAFNTKKYPLSVPSVRCALSRSLDSSILAKTLNGTVERAQTLIHPSLGGAQEFPRVPEPDQKEARRLLKEGGVFTTSGLVLDLLGDPSDESRALADVVKADLQKNLDVTVSPDLMDIKAFQTAMDLGMGALHARQWGADYPTVGAFLDYFESTNQGLKTGWISKEYDALLQQSRDAKLESERRESQKKAVDLLLKKECPVFPLYWQRRYFLLSSSVSGMTIKPYGALLFRTAKMRTFR